MLLGLIIFFIFFGGIFMFLGISLIRSIIISKIEHPYPYCELEKEIDILDNNMSDDDIFTNNGKQVGLSEMIGTVAEGLYSFKPGNFENKDY